MLFFVFLSLVVLARARDPLLVEICERTPHIRAFAENWCSESVSECKWKGVTCFEGRVISVHLSHTPIELTLPLTGLATSHVEQLQLSGCGIRGPLDSIVQNGNLNLIDLSNNPVTGFVNAELLHSSVALRLSRVQVNTTVSQVLCGRESSQLQELDVGDNGIVDDLSACTGRAFPLLRALKLQGNRFVGRALFAPHLASFNISGNRFTSLEADVEPSFREIRDLKSKKVTDTIVVPRLSQCDMSGNSFSSDAPAWLLNTNGKNLNKIAKCKYEKAQI